MTGDRSALVAAAVAGQSLHQIATAATLSVSTVQRRLKDPQVVALVNEARAQHRQEALGRLSTLRTLALQRLGDLLDSDDATIVLRTATLVLATSTRLDMIVDHDQRLAALESTPAQISPFADTFDQEPGHDPID